MGYWSCSNFNPQKWVMATHLFLQCCSVVGVVHFTVPKKTALLAFGCGMIYLNCSLGLTMTIQLARHHVNIQRYYAFLSSALASSDLVNLILPPRFGSTQMLHVDAAITTWSLELDHPPPRGPASHSQKVWDAYRVRSAVDSLLAEAKVVQSKACLVASRVKESGAWLNAVPISSVGLRMDDSTVRIAVGLRLGTTLCHLHHCGAEVNSLHGYAWSKLQKK